MKFCLPVLALTFAVTGFAQQEDPAKTEVWTPKPPAVSTGQVITTAPPADAIILFDGTNLNEWSSVKNPGEPAGWTVSDKSFTVKKGTGNIQTKRSFGSYQLHIEWKIPANITGEGQARGNSGLFLASTGRGDDGYELQIMDSYKNETYSNGQAGSIYKQSMPLVNASKKPGEWQSYDVIWTAPQFNTDSTVKTPAYVTVFFNGLLIQDHTELKGQTVYRGQARYRAHGPSPIKLQDHGDPSEPISFRNIWIRELK